MTAPRFRGACPGLSVPMPTGDGLLARLMPAAPIPLDAMAGFCKAARRHGNGTIEISARGSLQVRGLTPRSVPLFAAAIAELGIAAHEGVPVIAGFDLIGADLLPSPDRSRLLPTSVALLIGRTLAIARFGWGGVGGGGRTMRHCRAPRHDPPPQPSPSRNRVYAGFGHLIERPKSATADFDWGEGVGMADVVGELRRAIANARLALSPKVSTVVDGGGPLHLDALSADIRLRLVAPARGPRFHRPRFYLGLGGDGASTTWLGTVAMEDVVGAVLGILTIIAAHGPTARSGAITRSEGVEAFRSVSAAVLEPSPAPPQRMPAEMIGLHPARDDTVAVGIGLAFGHTHADALARVVRVAAVHGARAVWPAPDRTMLLIGVSPPDALDLRAAAERLGFVVRAGDPRRRIAACPGAPACASGLIPARAIGSALHTTLEHALGPGRGIAVHISGCPKGCAHPMPAALTVVGTPLGCGIVHHGSARVTPHHYVDPANLADEISRIVTKCQEAAHG
jgi:precorrin-3B synthase